MKPLNATGVGLLILRVGLGIIFLLHGSMKIFGNEISFVQEMLTIAGLDLPQAPLYLVAVIELGCGLFLMAGQWTRVSACLLAGEMLIAVLLFHLGQGFFIVAVPNVPLAYGFEFHVALIAGLACLALTGPGIYSANQLHMRRR